VAHLAVQVHSNGQSNSASSHVRSVGGALRFVCGVLGSMVRSFIKLAPRPNNINIYIYMSFEYIYMYMNINIEYISFALFLASLQETKGCPGDDLR
jgi:hypothetical protein